MRKVLFSLVLFLVAVALPVAQTSYYPPAGEWARKAPAEVGMDPAKLADAVEFMKVHETAVPKRDFSDQEINMGKLLASMPTERGGSAGLPADAFSARGSGGNVIFIAPSHDLVVVWRWSSQANEGFKRVVAAITS